MSYSPSAPSPSVVVGLSVQHLPAYDSVQVSSRPVEPRSPPPPYSFDSSSPPAFTDHVEQPMPTEVISVPTRVHRATTITTKSRCVECEEDERYSKQRCCVLIVAFLILAPIFLVVGILDANGEHSSACQYTLNGHVYSYDC